MLNLTTIIFYVLAIVAPLLASAKLINRKNKTLRSWMLSAVLSSLVSFVLFIIAGEVESLVLKLNLESFDLDKNGVFTSDEVSEEQQKAMSSFADDTGLSHLLLLALFISPVICFFVHFLIGFPYFIYNFIINKSSRNSGE